MPESADGDGMPSSKVLERADEDDVSSPEGDVGAESSTTEEAGEGRVLVAETILLLVSRCWPKSKGEQGGASPWERC